MEKDYALLGKPALTADRSSETATEDKLIVLRRESSISSACTFTRKDLLEKKRRSMR